MHILPISGVIIYEQRKEKKMENRFNYFAWKNGACTNLEYYQNNYGGEVTEHFLTFFKGGKKHKMKRSPLYLIKRVVKDDYGRPYVECKVYSPGKEGTLFKEKIWDEPKISSKRIWDEYVAHDFYISVTLKDYFLDTFYPEID